MHNLLLHSLDAFHWLAAHPDKVGIYVGTAVVIAGSISALKTVRLKLHNSVFHKVTLRSLNVGLAAVLGFLSVGLQLQPLHGGSGIIYPIALVPAATTIYRIGSALQDWLNSFGEKKAAQEILVGNTLITPQPTAPATAPTKFDGMV